MSDHKDGSNNGSEEGAGASGDLAVVGEMGGGTRVSIQKLQGIYNELTGKTEVVGKSWEKAIRLKFDDLVSLNHHLSHGCEQYNIVSANCHATIYYVDDSKDSFSSFERFKLHSAGSTSAVESVLLTYNFLLLLPKTRQAQTYTVSIRIASRIVAMKKMEESFMGPPPRILRMMGGMRTAVVEVKYVDYMVARNILRIVDEWFQGIPAATEKKWLKLISTHSHTVPRAIRFLTTIFVALLAIQLLPSYVTSDSSDLLQFGKFVAYALLAAFVAYKVSDFVAGLIEDALDDYQELSYIQITRGDDKQIEDAERSNSFTIAKGVLGFSLSVGVAIVAKVIANILVP